MPRLSKSDTECVVQALRHLLAQAEGAPPAPDALLRILNRLSQRAAQGREIARAPRYRPGRPAAKPAAAFAERKTVMQVEEGLALAPKFDRDGLLPCITTDAGTGEVLMLGYMDREALRRTLATGEAHYWSRSRRCLWHKGAVSGLTQRVVEMRIDDDQDAIWLRVQMGGAGASCHVGYRSCFYRAIEPAAEDAGPLRLTFTETARVFDPQAVYGDAPNPTRL